MTAIAGRVEEVEVEGRGGGRDGEAKGEEGKGREYFLLFTKQEVST